MATPRSRRVSKATKSGKGIFGGKVFVLCGEFEKPHTTIKGWIEFQGGRVEQIVTKETTHLICTMEDFKSKANNVKAAFRLGSTKCKIVDIEFIKDCLILAKKPKLVPENPYELKRIHARKRKLRVTAGPLVVPCVGEVAGSKEVVEPPCHHVYIDRTGFEYKIPLHRTTSIAKGKKIEETLTIYLFESNGAPHTYLLGQKYKKTDLPVVVRYDKSVGKIFETAFKQFKVLFHKNTGIHWSKRLDQLKQDRHHYVYTPPSGGKPVGIPHGWKMPEQSDGSATISGSTVGEDYHLTAAISEETVGEGCHMWTRHS